MGSPQRGVRAAACNAGAPRLIDGEEVLACMPLSLLRTAPETLVNAAKRGKKKKEHLSLSIKCKIYRVRQQLLIN